MEARTPHRARKIPADSGQATKPDADVLESSPAHQRGLAETLADEWVLLFGTNNEKPLSDYSFKERYDDIDRQYKLLPDHEKTIFNRIIHRGIKDVIDTLIGGHNGKKATEIRIAEPRKR